MSKFTFIPPSTPFLYSAPRALVTLATSASASASQPSAPLTNIVDLRRRQEKAEKLQEEQQKQNNGDQDGGGTVGGEGGEENPGEEENNEASPSIFQKKVSKILTKLKLIAQIKNAIHSTPDTDNNDQNNQEAGEEHTPTETNNTEENYNENENNTETDIKNITDIVDVLNANISNKSKMLENLEESSSSSKNNVDLYYGTPKVLYNQPQRINLDVNGRLSNEKTEENLVGENVTNEEIKDIGKFGQLGVFFTELLGMLVGLAYGAAAQISNSQAQASTGSELL